MRAVRLQFRIEVQRALAEFREGTDECITFPATLTSAERLFVHYQCSQMGLVSKSAGKGDARQLTVRRKATRAADLTRAPEVMMHPRAEALLREYFTEQPPRSSDWNVHETIQELADEAFGDWMRAGKATTSGRGSKPAMTQEAWQAALTAREANPNFRPILQNRKLLPAWHVRDLLSTALTTGQVVIVSGDTGCGKSTQVPQFILDHPVFGPGANIIVTQPRRISAISLAERVAYERCEEVGGPVGYNVRLESATSAATRLTFVTTGVLLRRLTNDPTMEGITHIVLDEVHERDINTDCLLLILRDLLENRPDLRLIIMSATLQLELFLEYFRSTAPRRGVVVSAVPSLDAVARAMASPASGMKSSERCGAFISPDASLVHISGSAFPVTRYFLEDILTHTDFMVAGGQGHARMATVSRLPGARRAVGARPPPRAEQAKPVSAAAVAGLETPTLPAPSPDAVPVSTPASPLQPTMGPLDAIGAPRASEFVCPLCAMSAFDSVDDFAVHAAVCTGPEGRSTPAAPAMAGASAPSLTSPVQGLPQNLDAVGAVQAPELRCTLCGAADFNSVEDFGIHAALCFGGGANELEPINAAAVPATETDASAPASGTAPAAPPKILLPGGRRAKSSADAADDRTAEEQETDLLLEEYQRCVNDEEIDLYLLLALLGSIFEQITSSGKGARPSTPSASMHVGRAPADTGLGAILVFLPGWEEISRTLDMIRSHPRLGDPARVLALPLHSAIPTAEQRKVFKRPPPGVVKIILSTNIAETSITIDDIVYVVDAGKVREKTYDAYTGCSALTSVWISQASARQRAGRAGRVRPGIAYHLFSSKRHQAMAPFAVPEMLRTPLEELCLQLKLLGLNLPRYSATTLEAPAAGPHEHASDIERFLQKAVQPPPGAAVRSAVQVLHDIGALARHHHHRRAASGGEVHGMPLRRVLHEDEDVLTPLGMRLAQLPMSPRLAKMILFAVLFKCLDPVLTIACAMAYRSPFVLPLHPGEKRAADAARAKLARGMRSDHLALLGAFEGFQAARTRGGGYPGSSAEQAFCREHYISAATMNMVAAMRDQVLEELVFAGILGAAAPGADLGARRRQDADRAGLLQAASVNARNLGIVMAVLAAGVYPNVARSNPAPRRAAGGDEGSKPGDEASKAAIVTRARPKAQLHASSVANAAVAALTGDARSGPSGALASRSSTAVEWLIYDEMSQVGTFGVVALRNVSIVTPFSLLLLCGKQMKWHEVAGGAESDSVSSGEDDAAVRKGVNLTGPSEYEAALADLALTAPRTLHLSDLVKALNSVAMSPSAGDFDDEDAPRDDDELARMEPEIKVDDWVRFRLQPCFAVPAVILRNRLALAFHRCVLMVDAANRLAARGRIPGDFRAADEACVIAAAEVLSFESSGTGLDERARAQMRASRAEPSSAARPVAEVAPTKDRARHVQSDARGAPAPAPQTAGGLAPSVAALMSQARSVPAAPPPAPAPGSFAAVPAPAGSTRPARTIVPLTPAALGLVSPPPAPAQASAAPAVWPSTLPAAGTVPAVSGYDAIAPFDFRAQSAPGAGPASAGSVSAAPIGASGRQLSGDGAPADRDARAPRNGGGRGRGKGRGGRGGRGGRTDPVS